MKDHIGVLCLLQGTLKGLNQMMRKFSDKSYGIRQENLFPSRKRQCPRRRIQGREELIFRQDSGPRQFIKERRFARIRIPDNSGG